MSILGSTILLIFLVTIAPAHASPSLNLGSSSSYSFAGQIQVSQDCIASPVAYTSQACLGNNTSSAPTFVAGWNSPRQDPNTGSTTVSLPVCNLAGGCNAGDTIIVNYWQCCSTGQSLSSINDTEGNAYSEILLANGANVNMVMADVWGVLSIKAPTTSLVITVTFPDLSHSRAIFVQQYRNVHSFGASHFTGQPTCSSAPESLTTSSADSLVAIVFDIGFMTNMAQTGGPAAMKDFSYSNSAQGWGLFVWDSPVQNIGSNSWTWSTTGCVSTYQSLALELTSAPLPAPPPTQTKIQLGISGTLGWKVEGLSSSQANLLVSHSVSISVSPLPTITFTPVTESGSFVQSINLSTRIETPGTTSSVIRNLLAALASLTLAPSPVVGPSGQMLQNILPNQSSVPDYTPWWLNSPIANGSPVQILQGWSSVTGSEDLSLGQTVGTRHAWIVTSGLTQTLNLNVPSGSNPPGPSSNSTALVNLNLLWSFDKSSLLLLRNNDNATFSMHSTTPIQVSTSAGAVNVVVTRDTAFRVNLSALLSSTSLTLQAPLVPPSIMDALATLPLAPLGIAGIIGGLVSATAVLWSSRKAKRAPLSGSAPQTSSPPS